MNRKQRANFSISVLIISGLQFALSSSTTALSQVRPPVSTRPAKQLQNVKISSLSPEDVSLLSVESKKARATYLAGKLNDAVALQHRNVLKIHGAADASAESDARALLSFLAWQQGNVLLALKEGEAAV